jgi:hypothetical protein
MLPIESSFMCVYRGLAAHPPSQSQPHARLWGGSTRPRTCVVGCVFVNRNNASAAGRQ